MPYATLQLEDEMENVIKASEKWFPCPEGGTCNTVRKQKKLAR
jgi:hypothetical protein